MKKKIVITGSGVISAIGVGKDETLQSLRNHRTGIGPVRHLQTEHTEFPVGEVNLSDAQMKTMLGIPDDIPMVRTSLLGMLALREAIEDAQLPSSEFPKTAFISGTTVGGMDKSEQFYLNYFNEEWLSQPAAAGKTDYIKTHDCGTSTELIARQFGNFAMVTSISTACSSAANALVLGASLIENGEYERVIVGGAECLSKFHLNGFNSLMILDQQPCRPLDATRAGLNLGEGAGFLVLESEQAALNRGKSPVACLSGYGNACDAFHQTASSEDGEGAWLAMTQAINRAGLQPSDIQYVNVHGTGTPNNDTSECTAMQRVFGTSLPRFSSTKGFTGHTTSASGSIEAIFCLLALQHQFLPVSLHCQTPIQSSWQPVGIADYQPKEPICHILCNAFGFGGNDTSLVLSSPTAPTSSVSPATDTSAPSQRVLVLAANQISIQQPLCESWLTQPDIFHEPHRRSADPDFKAYMSPGEARRLGKVLKRALAVSLKTMQDTHIEHPDAIITGTGLGSVESTEAFLTDLCQNGEQLLKPTHFMQSTHNTIGSLVAISTRSHGYNSTYSHKALSFPSALYDAWLQMQTGDIRTALVGGHDGVTEAYFHLFELIDYVGNGMTSPCGEAAMATMLATHDSVTDPAQALCELAGCKILSCPSDTQIKSCFDEMLAAHHLQTEQCALLTGLNGKAQNDALYQHLTDTLLPQTLTLQYKNIFGECYSAPAIGFYAAAHILHTGTIPAAMFVDQGSTDRQLQGICLLEKDIDGNCSIILLKRLANI